MLMPKRVKYRKVQRGRMTGAATRGNNLLNCLKMIRWKLFSIRICRNNRTRSSYAIYWEKRIRSSFFL